MLFNDRIDAVVAVVFMAVVVMVLVASIDGVAIVSFAVGGKTQ
jgi:hypothetical protein